MELLRIRHSGDEYWARRMDEATARLWTDPPWAGGEETDRLVPIRSGSLLAPVVPTKIVCVGRNYRAHAAELGHDVPDKPLLFLKPPSALVGPDATVELPPDSERVEHEAELGVVVGARLRRASPEQARDATYGLTCVDDVTARDLQKQDVQFTRAKGFDTFCPCGPWITTGLAPDDLAIRLRVDGELRQDGRTSDMVFPVDALLSYVSSVMTLEPGDLLCTGTPAGVGPLTAGDRVEVEVEGAGVLRHRVERAAPGSPAADPREAPGRATPATARRGP